MHDIREASPDDNDSLIDLERRTPLDLGDQMIVFDRSPNFFAHQEMEEHGRVLVAQEDGRIVGIIAGAWHDVLIEGRRRRLLYIHQGRILPEYKRRRVATDLVMRHLTLARESNVDAPYWLISPHNSTSLAFGQQRGIESWPVDGRIDDFDVNARQPITSSVGEVEQVDLPEIVELVNGTHAGREMFLPYTVASLQARLERCPNYGWRQWRAYRSQNGLVAAAGLWDFNASLKITERTISGDTVRVSMPAFVLDYGYRTGAEEAMLEVFMALMEAAALAGRNELRICLPVERRLYSLMDAVPHSPTLFRILTPGIPTPKDVRGSVYLDPVYV